MDSIIPKFKKAGYTLNGFNYIGPLNDYKDEPVDIIDCYAMIHDLHYDKIIGVYGEKYPYVHYNRADENFITNLNSLDKDKLNPVQIFAINICVSYFTFKKIVFAKAENEIEFDSTEIMNAFLKEKPN